MGPGLDPELGNERIKWLSDPWKPLWHRGNSADLDKNAYLRAAGENQNPAQWSNVHGQITVHIR